MLKAVFFDLYETLITEFIPDWQPGRSVPSRMGIDEDAFRAEWTKRQEARYTGAIPDYPSVLRAICRVLQHPIDENLIANLHQQRLSEKSRPFEQIDEAVLHALRHIQDLGLQVGVISNCSPEEVAAWDASPIPEWVDAAIFSCDVGYIKPQPKIYRLACAELQVEPEECLYTGDGGSDELTGAEKAGLRPYWATWFLDRWPQWKQDGPGRERSKKYPRLGSLGELERVVEGREGG